MVGAFGTITRLLSGIVLGLSVAAPIGPVNVAVIRRGLASGIWAAFLFGMGAATADFVYVLLVYLGLAPILLAATWLKLILWIGGALWPGRIAWGALWPSPVRSPSLFTGEERPSPPPPLPAGAGRLLKDYLDGVGMTLLNPATIASWLVIGGSAFASVGEGLTPGRAVAFMLSIAFGSALWFGALATALHAGRRRVTARVLRWISVACGVVLLGFVAWFVWEAVGLILAL